jgi:uncharacterized membrane protein YkvA (DUF1232 family)
MKGPFGILALFRILSPTNLKLCYRLVRDKRTPRRAKLLVIAAIAYVVIPLDLLPDWTAPLFAFADDVVVLALALQIFIRLVPPEVVREHLILIAWEQQQSRKR